MKKTILIILLMVMIFFGITFFLFTMGRHSFTLDIDAQWLYMVLAVFFLPFIILYSQIIVLAHHTKPFQYYQGDQETDVPVSQDGLIHHVTGLFIALLQDFSQGSIVEPVLYTDDMLSALNRELQRYQVFRDQGWKVHIDFFHNEPHHMHVIYQISDTELVIEVDGIFHFYFEKNGQAYRTPYLYDSAPPFLHSPATMRLRIIQMPGQKQESAPALGQDFSQWIISGFSEGIQGLELGQMTR